MQHIKHLLKKRVNIIELFVIVFLFISICIGVAYFSNENTKHNKLLSLLNAQQTNLKQQLTKTQKDYQNLKSENQYIINKKLESEIKNIHDTYSKASSVYEALLDLKTQTNKTDKLDASLAKALNYLSEKNYSSADAELTSLSKQITDTKNSLASSFAIPANVPQNNTAPGSGYGRQKVAAAGQEFLVDIIAADLNSTKVIVDTASDGDCSNDCPVLSLGDYVSRTGAYAGINGSYFCPASYPSCAGKTNSFDTLLMNKDKKYFNSDNNVYSVVPAVIFSGNSARFVSKSLEWGRDTSVDAVIANQPLLVMNGTSVFGGDNEVKRSGKGSRSFVGATNNTAYIGVVYNASASEMALVLQTMGIANALNLDSGGSVALWYGGYKAGPGRNIPNAILFVKK